MEKYLKQIVEDELDLGLKSFGAVLVADPKLCGKTTMSVLFARSSIKLNTDAIISVARV